MRLPAFRLTMQHMAGVIAIVAIGFIPLNNPTRVWLGLLMYLKFGLLLTATFLARYGRQRDWWFGFAAFGWASILFCMPKLFTASWYLDGHQGIRYFDLTKSAGILLADLKGSVRTQNGLFDMGSSYTEVVQFWTTLTLAFLGGYLALIAASRLGTATHGSQPMPNVSDPEQKRGQGQ